MNYRVRTISDADGIVAFAYESDGAILLCGARHFYSHDIRTESRESIILKDLDTLKVADIPDTIQRKCKALTIGDTSRTPDVSGQIELIQYFRHQLGWKSNWSP